MKIDSIKNYISLEQENLFNSLIDEIYELSFHLNNSYPGYNKWFYEKHVVGCKNSSRDIIFIKNENDKIIAFSCLKNEDEKKICTIYVADEYRNKGIGSILFKESFKVLETTKPLITIMEDKLYMFEKIITKYKWELTDAIYSKYHDVMLEFCFNEKMPK